jgi:hypothetical protein
MASTRLIPNPRGEQASSAFVSGYLVLLFCKLMRDDVSTRDLVLHGSGVHHRRDNLVSVLEDFQVILGKTNEKIQDQVGGGDADGGDTSVSSSRLAGRTTHAEEAEIGPALAMLKEL